MSKLEGKFNFTKAYQELEEINGWFQQEDIDLDEGLEKYKRGLELIKQCRNRLQKAEKQFHEIKKEFSIEESKDVRNQKESANEDIDMDKNSGKEIPF